MTEDKELAFEACYSDFKLIRTRKVAQFIFEVPVERANLALTVLGGMPNSAAEVWCGIARLDLQQIKEALDNDKAAEATGAVTPRQPLNRYLWRAIKLAKDQEFWDYADVFNEEQAATFIRDRCHVKSRKDIRPMEDSGDYFDWLESEFIVWRDKPKYVEEK